MTDLTDEPEDTSGPRDDETLDKAIARVTREYKVARAKKEAADSSFADVDGRLNALRNLQQEIDRASDSYEAAHAQLKIDQQAYRDYHESELECLKSLLGSETETVSRKSKAASDALQEADQAVKTAQRELEQAESRQEDADKVRQARAVDVDELRQLAATIRARHGQLKSIRDAVTTAHQDGYYGLAYWLLVLGPYEALLEDAPKLIDPDDLPGALLYAVTALSDAEKVHADRESDIGRRRNELIEAERHLADREANGETELRDELKQIVPTEA